jgi:AraC family transcriptional regulator of adaptative response/methylated-DNA-[protein]-cysteine methyltransferase
VLAVCRTLDACEQRIPTLTELSERVGLSPHHLQRTFKRLVGVTPRQYADARRADRLRARLRKGQGIASSLYAAGYGSSSRLYEKASSQLGMSPGSYRRGGRGEEIRYVVARSPLGRLLVAGTPRGICQVRMGRTALELTQDLKREFPDAAVRRDEGHLGPWVRALVDYLRGELPWPALPVDVRATAFQRRVWEALRSIPPGETCTYEEVARRVGRPRAARAVARACAQNPTALAIPCHRVVRKDGKVTGYRWGADRRRALLALEREHG